MKFTFPYHKEIRTILYFMSEYTAKFSCQNQKFCAIWSTFCFREIYRVTNSQVWEQGPRTRCWVTPQSPQIQIKGTQRSEDETEWMADYKNGSRHISLLRDMLPAYHHSQSRRQGCTLSRYTNLILMECLCSIEWLRSRALPEKFLCAPLIQKFSWRKAESPR